MTNKSTKRKLISSVIALFICFAMMVGTTFAWFTDSVSSTNNKIVAGNLDIELYYQNDETSDWTKVGESTNIFKENTLWEPGHTEVVKFKIVNEGTLALKYQLGVNVASETPSTNVAGEPFKLSDYIKYGIVDGEQDYTRETAIAAVDATATKLNVAFESGTKTLQPKAENSTAHEAIVTMVVYMPETVGNEANAMMGAATPSINLGIHLRATQVEAEEDSFGPDYDEDAWAKGMKVNNEAELDAAIKNVEDGGLIILADDMTLETGVISGGTWKEGYYYVGDKSFTIDLNGNTLTNGGNINDYLMLFKNDGEKANTITFKNGTIEAGSSAYCAICTSTTSTQKITINLENVNLIGNNSNGAVAKIRGGAELNVKAGTVITGKDSYVCIEAVGNNTVVNVYEGTEFYQNGTTSYAGSLIGASNNATVNVYGGYGKSAQGGFIAMTSGGTINVHGGEWIANTDGTYANSNASVLIAQSGDGAKSTINVYGGTFKGGYNCYGNAVGDATINISGGYFNADPASYVADGYKAVESNGKYIIVSNNIKDENVVGTPAELNSALTNASDAGSGDNTIVLSGDIDLTNTTWTPIRIDGYNGAGIVTIEGNGATIKGLTAPLFAGGFAGKSGIIIKNLTIADSNIVSTSGLGGGAFIDTADSMQVITLENCHLVNSTVNGERTGGLIGWCSGYAKLNDGPVKAYVTITNCSVVDSTVVGAGSAGAIAGHPGASDYTYTTIENCVVKNVDVKSNDTGSWRTGAIVGTANNGHVVINNVTVEDVTLTQNGVVATETLLYGRFVPAGTGTLVIDGTEVLANATNEGLQNALASGDADLYLPAGEYKMPSSGTNGDINITGTKDTVLDMTLGAYLEGANVTIEGVTIKTSTGMVNGNGSDYAALYTPNVTYINCTFVGPMRVGRDGAKFINCTFTGLGNDYVWTYGNDVTFEGCTFNTDGKAILIYSDGGNEVANVTVKNCTFNSTTGAKAGAIANQNCAAIEIHNYGNGVNLVTEGNTYDSNFSGEWRIKTYESGKPAIYVNGVEYTTIAIDGKTMTIDGNKNVTVNN